MYKLFHLIMLVLIAVGLNACAAPNTTQMDYSALNNTEIVTAQDKALVYFVRPNMLGWPAHSALYDGSTFIGFVPHNGQLPYFTEPGEHLFMVTGESADFLKADLLASKTYYVQVQPRMGIWKARFSLVPVIKDDINSAQVQEWFANAVMVKNNEEAFKWAEKNREKELIMKDEYYKKWMEKPENKRPYLKPEDGI